MAVRNATLEQLGHKVKEEEIIRDKFTVSGDSLHRLQAKKLVHGLPSVEQKQQYPSRTLFYSVSPHSIRPGLSKWKSKRIMSSTSIPRSRHEAAVCCDQRGASQGTGKSWHGQHCCQKALCNCCSEERPVEAIRKTIVDKQTLVNL